MGSDKKITLRVGIFAFIALIIGTAFVFVIGERNNVFESKVDYKAVFGSVSGLRQGAQVRVAGVQVGSVKELAFGNDDRVHLVLALDSSAKGMIRQGSVATVSSKGMLGDKLVDIEVGKGQPLPPGSTISTEEPIELGNYLNRIGRFMEDAEATAENVRKVTGRLSQDQVLDDVESMIENVSDVTREITQGGGTIERLLNDKQMGRSVKTTVSNLQRTTLELEGTLKNLKAITKEVRSGDGSAHALIYGQEGKVLVENLAKATGEIAILLNDLRTKDGTLHDLIYEDKADNLLANLTQASADIRAITGDIRAGKGTMGRLITDPSLYEDVKRLVGDLERNKVLKALVRYSIKHDDPERKATPKARPASKATSEEATK